MYLIYISHLAKMRAFLLYGVKNATHRVCLVQRSVSDIVPTAAGLVQLWARMGRTLPRVRAGDRRRLSEAIHISRLLLIGNQILDFLTKELFNSLSEKKMEEQDYYSIDDYGTFRNFKSSNISTTQKLVSPLQVLLYDFPGTLLSCLMADPGKRLSQ